VFYPHTSRPEFVAAQRTPVKQKLMKMQIPLQYSQQQLQLDFSKQSDHFKGRKDPGVLNEEKTLYRLNSGEWQ
jgi:hypothetical protein